MTDEQFLSLLYFKKKELLTIRGEIVELIKFPVMVALDEMRRRLNIPMKILCATSGQHEPKSTHYTGDAVDFIFLRTEPRKEMVLEAAIRAGVTGFGIYWNGIAVSWHVDTGHRFMEMWRGWKRPGDKKWKYSPLISDIRLKSNFS